MRRFFLLATVGLPLVWASTAGAQHRHQQSARSWHQAGHLLFDPHGKRVTDHHDHYRYVLPSTNPKHGTYYTYENAHYYFPSQPQVRGQVAEAPRPIQPTAIEFGGFTHVDDLSGRLETLANQLCLDLHHNYQNNPGFAEIYGHAFEILQAAKWAHAKEHQNDREGLGRTLGPIDGLFHHVQESVQGWHGENRRQVGNVSTMEKVAEMEALIHHLMHEIGVRPAHDDAAAAPRGQGEEQAPPPAGRRSQPGLPPAPSPR